MDPAYDTQHAQLIADLRRAGHDISDLWEWVNGKAPDSAGVILVHHLRHATHERLREGIARALTQKSFKHAVPPLLEAFRTSRDDSTRWAIANAIAFLGFPKGCWDEVLEIAANPAFGRGRQNLVLRLHRIKLPVVEQTLLGLVDDEDVDAFAVTALGYCGTSNAYEVLRRLDGTARSPLFQRELPKAMLRIQERMSRQQ